MQQRKSCASCLMPFSKDPGVREHVEYCSYCFTQGKHNADGVSLEDFQSMAYKNMRKDGVGLLRAKFFTWTIRFAPYWKQRR